MQRLTGKIMAYAEQLPEGTALSAIGLPAFGKPSDGRPVIARFYERGELVRVGRGI